MNAMIIRRVEVLLIVLLAVVVSPPGLFAAEGEVEWAGGKWVNSASPAQGSSAGELAIIRQHQEAGNRRDTVRAVKKFIEKYPTDSLRQEAMLLAGEAQREGDRYWQAFEWYERLANEYPNGKYFQRALERQFKIAEEFLSGKKRVVLGFLRFTAYGDGQEILFGIAAHSPGSGLAERALMRVADFNFDRRNFVQAVETYDEYLDMFPKAHRSLRAMLRGAEATLADYQGPAYDGTPLIEARQRFLIFAEQFPAAAGDIGVEKILSEINDMRAQKAFDDAAFYERIDRPGPAKICYKNVIRDYSQTQWATQARQRISSIEAIAAKGGNQK